MEPVATRGPAELVDHRMSQPALPQLADDLSRRRAQRGTALRGQPEPAALDLGKPTGLDQQRPRERRDRAVTVEVAVREIRVDGANGHRGGTAGLLAAPQLTLRAQLQHRAQVELGFLFHQAHPVLPDVTQRACVAHRA